MKTTNIGNASYDYVYNLLTMIKPYDYRSYNPITVTLLTYIFKTLKKDFNTCKFQYEDVISYFKETDHEIVYMFEEYINKDIWEHVKEISNDYRDEVYDYILLNNQWYEIFGNKVEVTPDSIIDLSVRLFGDMTNKNIGDVCCGVGTFLTKCYSLNNHAQYYGIEINSSAYDILNIKNRVCDKALNIELGDAFFPTKFNEQKYDIVFANYPFGLRYGSIESFIMVNKERYPELMKKPSDWIFNFKILESLNTNGKAIVTMTTGSTFNSFDYRIRKYFVENNYIDTVISLAPKLYDYAPIPTVLMILNKNKKNRDINMVDASNIYHAGRRKNILSASDINYIVNIIGMESESSAVVSNDEIINNDCNLFPKRYIDKPVNYTNGVKLDEVIKSITRGAPCKAAELDKISSIEETDYQYLMLSNINNGIVDEELPYITKIEDNYQKYCVKNNSLVLSKMGAPIKMAVLNINENKKVLANGNLYVLELDTERINPYYLNAFFNSEDGKNALKRIMVGTTIPSIPIKELKNLIVPLPDMDDQNKIANEYMNTLDEIKLLNLKLASLKDKLNYIYDEGEVK